MKKALLIASVLMIAVISTACINNIAVQELNTKAAEYMQKGDYESAINRLQASIDLDSTIYETYYNLGIAAISAEKYKLAIDALQKGLKIKPEYSDFYYSLAIAQAQYADQILELEGENISEGESNAQIVNTKPKKEISEKDKNSVIKLKKQAIKNLTKYIEIEPETKNKEEITALIEELNDYLEINLTKVEK